MNYAFKDFLSTSKKFPAAFYFAWTDTKARYRRSTLGPLWLTLGTAIGVAGLGILWAELLNIDRDSFVPSLTVGLVVWQLISGCIGESSTIFSRHAHIIRNMKVPLIFFALQSILRQLVNFLHNLIVIVAVLLYFNVSLSLGHFALILIGCILLVGNLLWVSLLFGMFGARFRDVEPLIAAAMPILFFLSPVIYRPENLSSMAALLWFNPFAYLISVVRDPALGVTPDINIYFVSVLMLVLGWFLALWCLNRNHSRLVYWI